MEVMFMNAGIQSLIREDDVRLIPQVMAGSAEEGMQTFNMHLMELVKAGTITMEAAALASDSPEALKANLSGIVGLRDHGGITRHRT